MNHEFRSTPFAATKNSLSSKRTVGERERERREEADWTQKCTSQMRRIDVYWDEWTCRDGWIENQTRNRVAWLAEGRGGIAVGRTKGGGRGRGRGKGERTLRKREMQQLWEQERDRRGEGRRTSAEAAQKVNVQGANLFEVHGPRSTSKLSCRKPSCPIC